MAVTQLKLQNKEPNQNVIRALRRTLDRAKAGKIDGIIILGIEGNGDRMRSTAGDMGEATALLLLALQKHETLQGALGGDTSICPEEFGADVDPDDDDQERPE